MQKLESERAYKILLESLLCGRITQDAPLSERRLADEFGIGRTPIREALRHLARDGVVEMVPAKRHICAPDFLERDTRYF